MVMDTLYLRHRTFEIESDYMLLIAPKNVHYESNLKLQNSTTRVSYESIK